MGALIGSTDHYKSSAPIIIGVDFGKQVDSTAIVFPGQVARAHASGALFIENEAARADQAVEAQELSRA